MTTISFTKMHGAGNDYIYINTMLYDIANPAELAIKLSRQHYGIGSDGIILIGSATTTDADYSMRIFNSDGSEAMMCGNGARCVAKYLYDKGFIKRKTVRLETLAGIKTLKLHLGTDNLVDIVTVDMGVPCFSELNTRLTVALPLDMEGTEQTFSGTVVSMGNPHYVVFVEGDVETFPIEKYGPLLEHHPFFPDRSNIEFAQVQDQDIVRMRVWERGSGVTLACGTGACATAVAAHLTGRVGRRSTVRMDGGEVTIDWDAASGHVLMTGTAQISFEGIVNI